MPLESSTASAQLCITIRRGREGKGREEESIIEALAIPHSLLSIGEVIVRIDPCYFRPAEVESLLGDPANAKAELGRVPEITLDKMVEKMVAHDLDLARCHALLKANGYRVAVSKES